MLTLKQNEQVDWFRVIVDIERAGVSCRQMSVQVSIPHNTILGWKAGNGRPRFEEAWRVLVFWAECCNKAMEHVPLFDPHYPHRRIGPVQAR